jgi:peptide/nickel transport system ATP-binding protein
MMDRRPHELSGGQRQRVAIARALAAKPDVLVADEPTSMLDVSLRVGVLDVLEKLKLEHGLALLLITHDLAAARRLADRVLVMYRGRVVEEGPFEDVLRTPVHPYTQSLVAAVDSLDAPPAPLLPHAPSTGCPYASRCCHAWQRCLDADPVLLSCGAGRHSRCHLVEQGLAPHGLFRVPHAKQGTS